jgi:glycosyltransferase involved in cell wall biosynthesis
MSQKKDVAIWAHIPPPFGGMTVHVSRLITKLDENNLSYQMYSFDRYINHRRDIYYVRQNIAKWFIRLLFGNIENIHYVFTTRVWVRLLAVIIGRTRGKVIILRIGGQSLQKSISTKNLFLKYMSIIAIRYATIVIGVNEEICKFVIELGAKRNNVYHIPGFIPPSGDNVSIKSNIKSFFNLRTPLLVTSGQLLPNAKEDIYGIWSIIAGLEMLKKKYADIGLFIQIYEVKYKNHDLINLLVREIERRKLNDSVFIYTEQDELWPYIARADIYIRNTSTDGDANSIREAISLGTPVVASDCVVRPDPVITFRTGDKNSMLEKINYAIDNIALLRNKVRSSKMTDNSENIINLFQKYLTTSEIKKNN